MPIPPGGDATRTRLAFCGDFCIDTAAERREELREAIATGHDLELDLSEVARIDTAGLQLLLAAVLELGQRGHVVHFRDVPATVLDAARVTGLISLLGLPQQAES